MTEKEKLQKSRENFVESKPELYKLRHKIIDYSKNHIGDSLYFKLYNDILDSVLWWKENNLFYYSDYNDSTNMIDSVLCFNENKDKFISARLKTRDSGVMDYIEWIYGVKIEENWYFFDGAGLHLPREYYQENIHIKLGFETVKLLATKHIYINYLKEDWFGNVEINDNFFKGFAPKNRVSTGYGSCPTCETEDEYFLHLVNLNWQKRDKN